MYNEHFNKVKPPTRQMIEFLMECHERELMNIQPCEATDRGAKGLIYRQLVATEYFVNEKGKRYVGVTITKEGRNYLQDIV